VEVQPDSGGGGLPRFPDTRWSLVSDVQHGGEARERALADLCRIYWFPIYAFARRRGCNKNLAEDLTQDLFLKFLKHDSFASADRDRGRMRTFLLTSMSRLMASDARRRAVSKRAPEMAALSFERDLAEGMLGAQTSDLSPEEDFDRRWAEAILREVEQRLAAEHAARAKSEQFEVLKTYLLPTSGDDGYPGVAARLGLSEGAVNVAVFRLRQRFRALMREEVEQTLGDAEDTDEELRHLYAAMGRAR
jgi:RNA polymerase sigma factor (sigma-70 family)